MSMQLHRDLEVGVMSGTMEKEGFYGEEIQLYGFLYHDAGIKAVINENELTVALEIYNRYQSGYSVSTIMSKVERFYSTTEELKKKKQILTEDFLHEMKQECYFLSAHSLEKENIPTNLFITDISDKISGFVFWKDGREDCLVNGYFAQTVKWWLAKKLSGYEVSEIILQERTPEESSGVQLRQFREKLLSSSTQE